VADYAAVLDDKTEDQLNELLQTFELRTGIPFVVLTVEHTSGVDLPRYAARTAMAWGIRRKGSDRGVLMVYVAKEKVLGIDYGTELFQVLPPVFKDELPERFESYASSKDLPEAIYLCAQYTAQKIASAYNVALAETRSAQTRPVARPARGVLRFLAAAWLAIGLIWLVRRAFALLTKKGRPSADHTRVVDKPEVTTFRGGMGPFGVKELSKSR
jgi:uncharacterized membrane protein YgcG